MRAVFESVIARGSYDLTGLLANIDKYHIEGKLTDGDRDALYAMAREKANASASVDVLAKLAELDNRLRALEGKSTETETPAEPSAAPAYELGKWYYTGDKVTYGGKTYTCTAPDGVACVWSPEEYPAYWTEG